MASSKVYQEKLSVFAKSGAILAQNALIFAQF